MDRFAYLDDELFKEITPESAQRDLEDILQLKPTDPDYQWYFSTEYADGVFPLINCQELFVPVPASLPLTGILLYA